MNCNYCIARTRAARPAAAAHLVRREVVAAPKFKPDLKPVGAVPREVCRVHRGHPARPRHKPPRLVHVLGIRLGDRRRLARANPPHRSIPHGRRGANSLGCRPANSRSHRQAQNLWPTAPHRARERGAEHEQHCAAAAAAGCAAAPAAEAKLVCVGGSRRSRDLFVKHILERPPRDQSAFLKCISFLGHVTEATFNGTRRRCAGRARRRSRSARWPRRASRQSVPTAATDTGAAWERASVNATHSGRAPAAMTVRAQRLPRPRDPDPTCRHLPLRVCLG